LITAQCKAERYALQRVAGPYTEDGFSAIWQRLMAKHVKVGGIRFSFHDLRSGSADVNLAQQNLQHALSLYPAAPSAK
jgi:hypothetical protein